jgi:hypothetical protein
MGAPTGLFAKSMALGAADFSTKASGPSLGSIVHHLHGSSQRSIGRSTPSDQ